MIDRTTLTVQLLVTSLRSKVCPACGHPKGVRKSFCYPCYMRLPRDLKANLYDLVGEGYEDAMADALARLGCDHFHTEDKDVRPHDATP